MESWDKLGLKRPQGIVYYFSIWKTNSIWINVKKKKETKKNVKNSDLKFSLWFQGMCI